MGKLYDVMLGTADESSSLIERAIVNNYCLSPTSKIVKSLKDS